MENIKLQESEIEMLESMFPSELEFDPLYSRQSFRLHFKFRRNQTIELSVTFPENYPSDSGLDVYVRSDSFARESQVEINTDLRRYLEEFGIGELMTGIAASWIQENGSKYLKSDDESPIATTTKTATPVVDPFVRYWIYSHHLKSKIKRRDILNLAKDFNVNGFSLPGKPGILCLEGSSQNCSDMWNIIKSWNWQRIVLKIVEDSTDFDSRFTTFREVSFMKNERTDMGQFEEFLKEHSCQHIFKDLFGLK